MTTVQITVRLPAELVSFVDREVESGAAESRASLVARALDVERRRLLAEHDADIYEATGDDPELRAFVDWSAAHPPADLDDDPAAPRAAS